MRWRALLLTAGATVAIGLLVSMLPGKDYTSVPDTSVSSQLADAATDGRVAVADSAAPELAPGANMPGKPSAGNASGDAYADHALEKGSAEIEQRFQQGVVMLHARRYDDAITAFHRVLLLDPDMPEANINMGFALIGLERYAAARDFFDSAIALRRDQINAYYGLAVALAGMQDMAAAIGAMRTYRHLAPDDDPYRDRADALLKEWEDKRDQQRSETGQPK